MIKKIQKNRWTPYAAGFGIGITFLFSFFVFNRTLGSSVGFVKISAFLQSLFDENALDSTVYYKEYFKNHSWMDWQVCILVGVIIGSFIAAKTSICAQKQQPSTSLSFGSKLSSFVGGIIIMFAARFAGGCTSGHAISGGIQLAVSGYLFMIGVFLLGIPSAFVFRKFLKQES